MFYLFKLAEKVFFIFSFLLFSEALFSVIKGDSSFSLFLNSVSPINLPNDSIRIICNLFILIINIVLIFLYHKQIIQLAKKEKILWIFIGIAMISPLWSVDPSLSIFRFLVFFNATLTGIYFAARYTIKEQIDLLFWTLMVAGITSLIFITRLPELGIMSEKTPHPGAWQGIYAHKNIFGRIMALSALVSFLKIKTKPRYISIALIGLSLSILLIIGSTSQSSLLIFCVMFTSIAIYQLCQWSYKYDRAILASTVFLTIFLAFMVVLNTEMILELMGRNATLTGRVPLWHTLFDKIWVRPWLGYGYGGFWQSTSKDYLDVQELINWPAPHGHNGFIDLWLELGLVGLSVFLLSFIYTSFRAIKNLWPNSNPELLFPVTYLLFLLLANIIESSLLGQESLWLLYVATVLSINKQS